MDNKIIEKEKLILISSDRNKPSADNKMDIATYQKKENLKLIGLPFLSS